MNNYTLPVLISGFVCAIALGAYGLFFLKAPKTTQTVSVPPHASFHLSQLTAPNTWEEKYVQSYEVFYTTKTFTFAKINNNLTIRIEQKVIQSGDVEFAELRACGKVIQPNYAKLILTNEDVMADILKDDNNVVIVHDSPLELSWTIPETCNDPLSLTLKANEYVSDEAAYARFPERGKGNQQYTFRNNETITVDGLLHESDTKQTAQFAPLWHAGTGHPTGTTYLYLNDDSTYVYVSVDVTGDNTNEYGTDWIEVTAYNTKTGTPKTYRVTDLDPTYGQCAFGLTSKVSYKHQTCELKVPKSDLNGNSLTFSLQYYGTFVIDINPPMLTVNALPSKFVSNLLGSKHPVVTGTSSDVSFTSTVSYQVDSTSGTWHACSLTAPGYIMNFTCSISASLPMKAGTHHVYFRATDTRGNTTHSGDESSKSFTVNTPSTPVITQIGSITGIPNHTSLQYNFSSQKPTISGTGPAYGTVYFVWGGHTYASGITSSGNFSLTLDNPKLDAAKDTINYYAKVPNVSTTSSKKTLILVVTTPTPSATATPTVTTTVSVTPTGTTTPIQTTVGATQAAASATDTKGMIPWWCLLIVLVVPGLLGIGWFLGKSKQ